MLKTNMKKLSKNELGFGAVEILLVAVIAGVLGFVGWYVLKAKNNTNTNYNNAASSSAVTKPTTTKTTPKNTNQSLSVVLSRQDYSFKAPTGWKYTTSHPGLGDVYEDTDGNQIIVTEDLGYDNNVRADYAWEANADISSGVKIIAKSQACNNADTQTSFNGFTYTCDNDSAKTVVLVFVAAQGGEIHAGSHIYRLFYAGKDALLSQYETILGTFSSK